MKAKRFSIAGLMGLVLISALSLTALRSHSSIWAGSTLLVTIAILMLGVVGAVCRKGSERAWWVGFALFGWSYLAVAIWQPYHRINWPIKNLILAFGPGLTGGRFRGLPEDFYVDPYVQVGQSLISLVVAVLGGLLARWLFGAPAAIVAVVDPQPEVSLPRTWRRPVVVRSAALAVTIGAALGGLLWAPGWWAGVVVLFTWGWLGLTVVGAICRRGTRRTACVGAAIFGIGYITLIFSHGRDRPNWPHVATEQLLNALRPSPSSLVRFRPASPPILSANARLLNALDQPIRMPFDRETPLAEVLDYIHAATSEPDYAGIAIYVDPVGLQEAEKTMKSPIRIDLEGVPLRTSLQLALAQLGMNFTVRDGLLIINSMSSNDENWDEFLPFQEDPYLVVGHCLLALFAALLGGSLAPLVADP